MIHIVDAYYQAVRTADAKALADLVHPDFVFICPNKDHVFSGVYIGKQRFFDEVFPHVFACIEPAALTFCARHKIVAASGNTVVAMAQNDGFTLAGERYDQTYVHIFELKGDQVIKLTEVYDTALANRALWGDIDKQNPTGLSAGLMCRAQSV